MCIDGNAISYMLGLTISAGMPHAAQSYKHAACTWRGLKHTLQILEHSARQGFWHLKIGARVLIKIIHILINYLLGSKAVGYLIVRNTNISTLA